MRMQEDGDGIGLSTDPYRETIRFWKECLQVSNRRVLELAGENKRLRDALRAAAARRRLARKIQRVAAQAWRIGLIFFVAMVVATFVSVFTREFFGLLRLTFHIG